VQPYKESHHYYLVTAELLLDDAVIRTFQIPEWFQTSSQQ